PLSRFLAGVGVLVYHAAACFPFPGAESRPREGTPQGVRMPAQLDLVITLTAPPEGTAPQTIALFSLRYADLDPTPPAPLANPLTDVERADLRWYLEEYWKWPYEGFRERAEAIEQSLAAIGRRIYDTISDSREAVRIIEAWRRVAERERRISIVSGV